MRESTGEKERERKRIGGGELDIPVSGPIFI